MRFLLIFGFIMLFVLGVSQICATGDIYKTSNEDFSFGDGPVDCDAVFSKHYRPEFFNIIGDYVEHKLSDFFNFIEHYTI